MPLRKRNLLTEVQYLFRALFAFCLPVWPDVVCRITRARLSVRTLHITDWGGQLGSCLSLSSRSVIPTLCGSVDCSTPALSVLHWPLELAQTHVHRVGDAVQLPHPLSSPSPPALSLSQHQGLFPVSWPFTSGG